MSDQISSTTRFNSRIANVKDQVKKETQERKRNILYLIHKYLSDHNLQLTAEALENEVQLQSNYQVCDNLDLEIMLQEYQSYYYMKYQKYPNIIRKLNQNEQEQTVHNKKPTTANKSKPKKIIENHNVIDNNKSKGDFDINIRPISRDENSAKSDELILDKPLIDFENYSSEWREIANQIIKQIVPKNQSITTWNDCIGLEDAAELLKEAAIYPIIYSEVFNNIPTWKGILLYGPPGTGKTLLARALTHESPATLINVTNSLIISKWRGESEKFVKVLFDVAKHYAPTIIFFDEVDAIACANKETHHEASRRFKTELLTQIDGIIQNENIVVLATTNTPWDIDPALLRRFEKRIFVPLPNENVRLKIFQHYLKVFQCNLNKQDELICAKMLTDNYSGSDIKTICKEANMIIIRDKIASLKLNKTNNKIIKSKDLNVNDVICAIEKLKPCIQDKYYQKYLEWSEQFGSL